MKRSRPNVDFKRSNTMSTQPSTPTTATSTAVTNTTTTPVTSGGASSSQAPVQAPTVGSTTPNTSTTPTASFFTLPGGRQNPTSVPYIAPLPSCLMPESFTGKGDFEDYLQQFNTAALLSGWYSNAHDNRPHYFALRLRENALHFYTTLSPSQQTNFDMLVDAFRQNYTINGDILKARLKAAKQQPNQDISSFLCDVRTLARRAYRDHPAMIDPVVLTCFIEGLSDKTLRWELRKAKLATADDALSLAMELNSFLEIENGNPQAAQTVNRVSTSSEAEPSASKIMADFVRSLQTELQSSTYRSNNDFHQRGDTKSSNKNDHSRSQSNDSNRSGQSVRFQSSQGRERPNNAGRSDKTQKQQYRQDSPHPKKQGNNNNTQNNRKPCERCTRKNHTTKECKACFNCLRVGHFQNECKAPKREHLN